MKIALVNNMNNNFFAFSRYLKDAGHDAHLFIIDPVPSHFLPTADTFEKNDNLTYVHYLDEITFKEYCFKWIYWGYYKKIRKIRNALKHYDLIIASGFVSYFIDIEMVIDVFIPYGTDLLELTNIENKVSRWKKYAVFYYFLNKLCVNQRSVIQKARAVITLADLDSQLKNSLNNIRKKWINWSVPMIYPITNRSNTNTWKFLDKYNFICFSHTRHQWQDKMDLNYKGNDIYIRGFAKYVKNFCEINIKPILILFNYGRDCLESKLLIGELGIEEYVVWMPVMDRKYIFEGIKKSSLVFDIFNPRVVSVGGVSFEAYLHGVPAAGNNLKNECPTIHAIVEDDVCNILKDCARDSEKYKKHGSDSKLWFHENVGVNFTKRYVELLSYMDKNKEWIYDGVLPNLS